MGQVVVLGVCGGIAAYKAAALCSLLVKSGYEVQVLMTAGATRFIQPLTFQALSKHPVVVDTFQEPDPGEIAHIAIADKAALFLIAPATANMIAKLAHGIADDMVSTTALAVTAPTLLAPAMNVHMFEHVTVATNLDTLKARGIVVMDPGSGPLACGYTGKGRLPEPEDIVDVVNALLRAPKPLQGVKVVVTAGPTIEPIDPVRYLSNASTGKMGYAIAQAAVAQGATVSLVTGPTQLAPVIGATMVRIATTDALLRAVTQEMADAQVLIAAAAPVDFRPTDRLDYKWKKHMGVPHIEFEQTPDVLASVAAQRQSGQIFVGFAAETSDAVEQGRRKLDQKQLDMVVVNDVSQPGVGFAGDTNQVTLVTRDGSIEALPMLAKSELAERIVAKVIQFVDEGRRTP